MNNKKIVLRLLVSPFILGILFITYTYQCVKHFIGFVRYGGEWVTYEKEQVKVMADIYKVLKDKTVQQ